MSYRGNRGRGKSRGGGGGGGYNNRGNNNHQHNNDTSNIPSGPAPRFAPCKYFTSSGACTNKKCSFGHQVKLHGSIDASSPQPNSNNSNNNGYNNNNYNQSNVVAHALSSVALWETTTPPASLKIFSGSHDGFWRLWNTAGGTFAKEFEHSMGPSAKILQIEISNNHLFCAFEGLCNKVPKVAVGMIHVWNLSNPADPPLEFHLDDGTGFSPYAAARGVTAMVVNMEPIVSGSRDGVIRCWRFDPTAKRFAVINTLHGHAREISGLVVTTAANGSKILWSSSIDRTMRLWDLESGKCQYLISAETKDATGNVVGHTDAITALLVWDGKEHGNFVLSASLDGSVKAWSTNAECVASETHGQGVVSISLVNDASNRPLLMCGLENGNIMIRSVLQTQKTPAFCLLMTLSSRFTNVGHTNGPVKCIRAGPSATFYTGGNDGKVNVWQVIGDFDL